MTSRRSAVGLVLLLLVGVGVWLSSRPRSPSKETSSGDAAPSGAAILTAPRTKPAPLHLSAGESSPIVEGATHGELAGRVVSVKTGEGVPNAVLVFSNGGAAFETRSTANGAFVLRLETAGTYQLSSLIAAGFLSFSPEPGHSPIVFAARPGAKIEGVTLFITPGEDGSLATTPKTPRGTVRLRGFVRDDQKRSAIGGALVTVQQGDRSERVTTDDEGEFTVTDLAATPRVTVRASHPDWVAREVEVAPATDELVLLLSRGARVTGTVRQSDSGKPIVAFTVMAQQKQGAMERGRDIAVSFFDGEGRYTLTGLAAGTQCLSAVAHGRAPSSEQCIEVALTGEAKADFVLGKGAKISGRVFDRKSKEPIARATVGMESFHDDSDGSPLPVVASTETDERGQFTLAGLSSGVRSIFVQAKGHHSRVLPGQQLDADHPPPPIEIDLLATEPGEEPRIESAGLNIAVRAVGDQIVIEAVSPGGGAAEAGLLPGDIILRVDGAEIAKLGGMTTAIERMRGPEGSTVLLSIQRGDKIFDVLVTRRRIINR